MRALIIPVAFVLITLLAAPSFGYTLSGTISGGEWFGGITYVYGFRVDTLSLTPYIGLALLGNGPYLLPNAPAGSYTLLAFQDLDGNLIPSINDRMGFYGDTLPAIIEVTGNTSGLDIALSELPFTSISGRIACPAGPTGLTLIQAATDPLFENVAATGFLLDLTGNGTYSIFLDPGQYYVAAFLDADLSFSRTPEDPQLFWGAPNQPALVNVSSQSADSINMNLMLPPQATLTMTPVNPPIVIPPGGGSFDYNVTLTNNETLALAQKIWMTATLPNGSTEPVLGPISLNLPAGFSGSRIRTQNVPAFAPAGNYSFNGYFGLYPAIVWLEDSFPFSKSGSRIQDSGCGEWSNFGEDFNPVTAPQAEFHPTEFDLQTTVAPNPFNPTTAISFQLTANSHVSLKIHDTAGRLVATLADGHRAAGTHEVTFDGSGLASGMYLYTLTVGGNMVSGKMILMK